MSSPSASSTSTGSSGRARPTSTCCAAPLPTSPRERWWRWSGPRARPAQIAGLLKRPDRGDVIVAGSSTQGLGDDARTRLRRETLGFVYQNHHLLPEFSALENIVLPQMVSGRPRRQAAERARERLAALGLAERAEHRPGQLSGGEQQRVAIGRALANDPLILLADEPTGSLDQATSETVFELLLSQVRAEGLALLLATHNLDLAARADRILRLENGVLVAG